MDTEEEELEQLRKKRLMELQMEQQLAQQEAVAQQQESIEEQRAAILRRLIAPDARERLATLKMAYPDVALSVEDQIIALAQAGRLKKVVQDEDLKQILAQMQPKKKDISIKVR